MLLIVIAFVGGAFTVLSPCILPVVPFVFARSEEPFLTGRLPMLLGLALTFALLTGLGAAGLNGAAQLSEYGRWIALGLFALFGAALLFPALATRLVDLLATPAAVRQTPSADPARHEERVAQARPAVQDEPAAHIVRVSLPAPAPAVDLPVEGRLPALDGANAWLNSAPLTPEALRGKVVLVNFWTYSCINCLRTLPYLKTWADRYRNDGLVVIGVHTPEFGFEHDTGNVKRALANLDIRYPVAVDSDYRIWNAFGNQYWPAFYLVDAQGRVRYHHFGEGDYAQAEQAIQQLLADNGRATPAAAPKAPQSSGALAPADQRDIGSGETYVGYREAQGNANAERVQADTAAAYTLPGQLDLNQWAFGGQWNVGAESAVAGAPQASIAYRFHARDLHLVLAPTADGKPVRFRISIDGAPPGAAHGADVAADGTGVATSARLYQLVRQSGRIGDHTFEIRFLDPGAHVYSFTFG